MNFELRDIIDNKNFANGHIFFIKPNHWNNKNFSNFLDSKAKYFSQLLLKFIVINWMMKFKNNFKMDRTYYQKQNLE